MESSDEGEQVFSGSEEAPVEATKSPEAQEEAKEEALLESDKDDILLEEEDSPDKSPAKAAKEVDSELEEGEKQAAEESAEEGGEQAAEASAEEGEEGSESGGKRKSSASQDKSASSGSEGEEAKEEQAEEPEKQAEIEGETPPVDAGVALSPAEGTQPTEIVPSNTAVEALTPAVTTHPPVPRFRPAPTASFLPVLTPNTVSRDTYDLDLLLDSKAQRQLTAGHRFSSPSPFPVSRLRSLSPSVNHISLNKSKVAEKSSLRVSLDNYSNTVNSALAGLLMSTVQAKETQIPDVQHFWDYRSQALEKTKQREKELIRKELAGCTFHPVIIKEEHGRPKRDSEEYYNEMVAYRAKVAAKVKFLKSEADKALEEEESEYFKPTICIKSRKIDMQPDGKRYQRLYELHKGKIQRRIREAETSVLTTSQASILSDDSDTEPSRPFHPHINKRSQHLSRGQPVEDLLYQEAFTREEKLRQAREVERKPAKLISGSSEHLLMDKFQSELDSIWTLLEGSQPDMSYMKFVTLLTEMAFIENNQEERSYEQERDLILRAWNSFGLSPDQRVSKRRVEVFLYSIMNFWLDNMAASPTEASFDSDSKAFTSDPGLHTTPEKAARLHAQFRPLYEHRTRKLDKSSVNPSFRYQEELPFRPKLDRMSVRLAEEQRSCRTERLEDVLIAESKKIKEKNDQKRAKMQQEELKKCSFRPEINKKSDQIIGSVSNYSRDSLSIEYIRIRKGKDTRNEVLFQLAAVAQERKKKMEKDPSVQEEEDNLVECTFVPDLSASKAAVKEKAEEDHWGVEETIGRLKKARDDAKRVKVMTERGFFREEEPEPLRFTVDKKHKLIPEFNPSKAPGKKVGRLKEPRVTAPSPPKPKPRPRPVLPVPPPLPELPAIESVAEVPPPVTTEEAPPSLDPPIIRETSEEELKSEENEPLLTIAVALSETEKDSINYYAGDQVEDLARQFVEKHGLPASDVEKLTELIKSKMEQTTE